MEQSFNHRDFTGFFKKEMLASSFSFPSTNFHTLCYLKRALFRLKNYHELSRFFCGQQYRFRGINALDLKKFRIQLHNRKFLSERVILMDSEIICILFGSNQSPVFLKITTAAFLIRETLAIAPTNLLKQDLAYLPNAS